MMSTDFLKAFAKQVELDMGWVTVTNVKTGKVVHYGDKDRRRGRATRLSHKG